ncbi:F0F1 ATP synthase subunit C [Psittacicella gerlachiana]|uniref:ATP synthase F(0) sector subunit c n=1 Tax=Psittacicella gerlachiana TaxID=2028574 RepID=A0A3A1Y8A0_9GAMM|nr:F0F1 ATP synthase subunit C [Psittacicella gerlachiana]RIY33438.1 ATP F0F1 synthase subunit C [Psittacicella gerlachiana]
MDQTVLSAYKELAAAIIFTGSSLSAALGLGILGSKYIESCARQPELIPTLRSQFFLVLGLVDAVPMISLAFAILYALGVI